MSAAPNLGQIIAEVYQDAYTKDRPYHYYMIVLKNRERFIAQATSLGREQTEWVTFPSGRGKTAHFIIDNVDVIDGIVVPVYVQPKKSSEPTLRTIPKDWTPYEWKAPLPPRKPDEPCMANMPTVFTSLLFKSLPK